MAAVLPINDPMGNLQRSWGRVVPEQNAINIHKIPLNPAPDFKQIDDYIFTPLGKIDLERHEGIIFTSKLVGSEELIHYSAYRSISASGMWHLHMSVGKGAGFVKGEDYVQSTLLHISLQIYFSDWYSHPGRFKTSEINESDTPEIKRLKEEMRLPFTREVKSLDIMIESIQTAGDTDRILNNLSPVPPNILPFKEYASNKENTCGNQLNKYKNLLALSARLEQTFPRPQLTLLSKNYIYETTSNKLNEHLTIVGDFYSIKFDEEIILYFLKYRADILINNFGRADKKNLTVVTIKNKKYTIDNFSQIHDRTLEKMFQDKETKKIISHGLTGFLNKNSRKLLLNKLIEKIRLNPENYMNYLTEIHPIIHQFGITSQKFIPICLTTITNKILKQGLNSHFISAGDYLCKLFDYGDLEQKQTPFLRTRDIQGYWNKNKRKFVQFRANNFMPHPEFHMPIAFGPYFYLGWKYDEIYPFNLIKRQEKIKNALEVVSNKKVVLPLATASAADAGAAAAGAAGGYMSVTRKTRRKQTVVRKRKTRSKRN